MRVKVLRLVSYEQISMIWKAAMVDPALRAVFDALEINAADAWALFQQLDTATCLKLHRKTRFGISPHEGLSPSQDGDNNVDVDEFLEGTASWFQMPSLVIILYNSGASCKHLQTSVNHAYCMTSCCAGCMILKGPAKSIDVSRHKATCR